MSEVSQTTAANNFPFRYDAQLANEIELKWQDTWEKDQTYFTPNPVGPMSDSFDATKEKLFVLDMFPYPSGAGLHVGHPLGFISTDIYARFKRMTGFNVLHAMGYDAFGLPAEQYAVQTGTHPRITTETNIANMKAQMRRLGLGHDERRGISTIDPEYYKWTQWIFLTIYNSYFDEKTNKAQPIEDLVKEFESGVRNIEGRSWNELSDAEQAAEIDNYRLAYLADSVVNWCPGLGTVLANEEVTADGKSERGNFDVFKRPMKQWMMRITQYADRLIDDLEELDWTDAIKSMQRNWIGKSHGMLFSAPVKDTDLTIQTFSAHFEAFRADVFVVIAPDHPFLKELVAGVDNAQEILDYSAKMAKRRDGRGFADDDDIDGIFTGRYIQDPVGNGDLPIWVASFALANYGTGIVKCSAHDERDFKFAKKYDIPLKPVLFPPDEEEAEKVKNLEFCYNDMVHGILSEPEEFDGAVSGKSRDKVIDYLVENNLATPKVSYKLRDWLFSRQRYWGEPFPVVFDENGRVHALPESLLPVTLPDLDNFAPESSDDPDAEPKPPLARIPEWVNVELDLGDGKKIYRRDVNTMPNWAGSCWYYLRYLDPFNEDVFVDSEIEKYWAGTHDKSGIVDLYVGGVEHAVLHLLYARFWHKVLFDRGFVSTPEPFQRLINQGYIQAHAYTDARGFYVEASQVVERDGKYFYNDEEVNREYGKIGKSLKNVVTPDDMCADYGADTLRLYEMFMGPLEASRPWSTADVAGSFRLLQRLWRCIIDEETGEANVTDEQGSDELIRITHKTIDAVRNDYNTLSFNTAIAKIFELNNALTRYIGTGKQCPRDVAQALVLMLAPLTPHIAEELWSKLGHTTSVVYEDFPVADERYLVDETIEIPVQILGKVKARINISPDATAQEIESVARADDAVIKLLDGKNVVKVIAVPGRMINFVVS